MLRIRTARAADTPALCALLTALDYPGSEAFIAARLEQLLAHPDARLLVAEEAGQVLGFISLHFIPQLALAGDFCRVSYFCVSDAVRSQGIGAALEQAAEQAARERGCDRIELHCAERRQGAHRFYARQGYRESPKYLMKRL
ncbi:N-acetyltransferase family protein [Pseudomonas sp. LRF_L74]|uniref:GNAT family N-acetyltransferase n=1 Tax=Pseudomonas sp. LRF_L74 TaxID=3369422 RepID=UPI003F62CEF9